MKEFWNDRYRASEYAYGTEPNAFFKSVIDPLPAGRLLLPAEGEGRNAIYAAQKNWHVFAYDISEVGIQKAQRLAEEKQVTIDYQIGQFGDHPFQDDTFDLIALIYCHAAPEVRKQLIAKSVAQLVQGGTLCIEAFGPDHLHYKSENPLIGGPSDAALLYHPSELTDLGLHIEHLEIEEIILEEGLFHRGKASVVRYIGKKQ